MIQYPGRRVLVPTPNLGGVGIFQPTISGISYLLRDEFTTDLPAGSVNGTPAEPGPGTRTVVDSTNALSISGSALQIAGVTASWADPAIWYDAQTKTVGLLVMATAQLSHADFNFMMGFDDAQSGNPFDASLNYVASTGIRAKIAGSNSPSSGVVTGVLSPSTDYTMYGVLGNGRLYLFIKGDVYAYPELLWIATGTPQAILYPTVHIYNSLAGRTMTVQAIRIPDALWLPTPVAYDSFTRANGALGTSETSGPDGQDATGRTWNFDAGIWTVDTNKAKGSPVAGGELFPNPGFEGVYIDGLAPDHAETGVISCLEETVLIHGGSSAQRFTNSESNLNAVRSSVSLVIGTWYLWSVWARSASGTPNLRMPAAKAQIDEIFALSTSYAQFVCCGRSEVTSSSSPGYCSDNVANDIIVDDESFKGLTLSELFASVDDSATSDVVISADVTLTGRTQAGIVMNLDDESNPANFVIAYHDGTNAKLEKCVAGVYTTVISAAATYSAGATLVVIKDGNDYSLFYNNAKIGSTSTISDAGIVSNTKHGLFSTYSGNRLDNFTLFPRGAGGEYSDLDNY